MEKAGLSSDATWAHGLTRVQQPGPVTVGGQSGRRGGSAVGVSGRRRSLRLKNGGAAAGSASVALTPPAADGRS